MLTVPGLLLRDLFGSDSHTSAWVDTFRLVGLPPMVIFYALLNRRRVVNERASANTPADITYAAAGVIAGVCLLTFLATASHTLLPPIINSHGYANAMLAANAAALLL